MGVKSSLTWVKALITDSFSSIILHAEVIKEKVVPIDMSSIGIKIEMLMQEGCRDQGSWLTPFTAKRKDI